ncbi:H-NS histone family protein [Caballeronia sp. LZ065]|uniref:H-NS histone family protein n=1 Tax=Caballeronia sp. LZ065 TaxID=3038571 RepID=UPI0028584D2C|nr:H-NS histone family protein [Caballeronia sp. LZ065]MDR5782124.1 H-NS histone family protein [Caballeronia sp. LZ065]
MATLAQLENQIQELQRRADALREEKSLEAIASIRALMQEYGLTMADLVKAGLGKMRGRPAGSRNTSARTGRGQGTKLPPKYRNPESGATWSGHARAPAWIKEAPDRSVYLIEPAADKPASNRAAPASRAAGAKRARKTGAKKAAKLSDRAEPGTGQRSVQRAAA